jgi:hypothetical protein
MSEQKLKDIKYWMSIEGMTGHFMPDQNPVQQMALAVVYGMEHDVPHVTLKDVVTPKEGE